MWPFRKPEQRQTTEIITGELVTAASGTGITDYRKVGSVQAAAALVARCLASADVRPEGTRRAQAFTSAVLHDMGRALILEGEAVYCIHVDPDGSIKLLRAIDHFVIGAPRPATWRYRLTLSGPTQTRTLNLPETAVLHFRVNEDPHAPHIGRSPFALAESTSRLAAGIERQLSDEADQSSVYVLPAPMQALGDQLTQVKDDIKAARGRAQMVPSMAGDFGTDAIRRQGGGSNDWKPQRLGFNPPDVAGTIREAVARELLSIAGISPTIFAAGSQSAAAREAFRSLISTTIEPLAAVIEAEASMKLAGMVDLSFEKLESFDLQARARSFKSLIDGGMDMEKAAAASGILMDEGDTDA